MQKKNKTPIKLFVVAFAVIAAVTLYQNLSRQKIETLLVQDNKGVSVLETAGDSLVCIFQDGRTCIWGWTVPYAQQGDFQAASAQAVVLGPDRLAAVSAAGPKVLTVHSLPQGQPQKAFSVGFEDQDVWLRVSFDKSFAALIRKNPADSGQVLYEFMSVDFENELTGPPVPLSINAKNDAWVDYAVDSKGILYAAGSRDKTGRLAAINLETGSILWDRSFEGTKEFCSVIGAPDGRYLLAGNRDGLLYKIKTADGEIEKTIALLEPGETRPITNDYSVLNLAFSPDGAFYAVTMHPVAYLLKADSDKLVHKLTPANKLVSKIVFSPDNQWIATSDIRASYPVKIWPMPKKE